MVVCYSEPMNTIEKLLAKVRKEKDGCWIWLGHKDKRGYGQTSLRGRDWAHRIFYRHFKGQIPEGTEIDHKCNTPSCVNPKHLQAISHRENQLRGRSWVGKNARKTHCPKAHPYSKRNTYINPHGARVCRACAKDRERKYLASLVVRTSN